MILSQIIVMQQVTMQTRVISQQHAELQHWSGLSTVTRFDAGNTVEPRSIVFQGDGENKR
jgi:hypothetical protein